MTIHVQLWSAVPSSWLSFQCCYVKGWSLIGWFLSHDLLCAAGILKVRCFISMRRGRAWKKRARRTATASLPLWGAHTARLHWNNETWARKRPICERALSRLLSKRSRGTVTVTCVGAGSSRINFLTGMHCFKSASDRFSWRCMKSNTPNVY